MATQGCPLITRLTLVTSFLVHISIYSHIYLMSCVLSPSSLSPKGKMLAPVTQLIIEELLYARYLGKILIELFLADIVISWLRQTFSSASKRCCTAMCSFLHFAYIMVILFCTMFDATTTFDRIEYCKYWRLLRSEEHTSELQSR